MKYLLLCLFSLGLFGTVHGQQFSFQMFFSDAIGNKDTITLGYDPLATEEIDAAFGEENIISVPLDTTLDVRVTNEWRNRNYLGVPGTFHTKKQITFYNCSPSSSLQNIDISTKHWPVTLSWDSSLFIDSCRNGSLFTSVSPGGWWDTGSPSDLWRQELRQSESVTFTSNFQNWFYPFCYINDNNDTIPVFWQIFGDSTILYVGMNEFTNKSQKAIIFPNPADDRFSVQIPAEFGNVISVEIFSSTGNLVFKSKTIKNINITGFKRGLYIVSITNSLGEKISLRMIRK